MRSMIIEYPSFDKLIGTKLGNYRLEHIVRQSNGGPVFLARIDGAEKSYQLRFVVGRTNQISKHREAALERFQYQAGQIVALQHPYILPLLDYGTYQGIPYLVSPHIPMRSLRERLVKNGAMDVLTIGRYLDQIAATLQYAHQHTVLHGGLSVDCIFIRLDGQVVVADFGIWQLLTMNNEGTLRDQFYGLSETCAPEQFLGRPLGPYTDVYALGAVLYQLLTGSPVFPGNTPDEMIQQHLYASVSPFSKWRSDLPAGLYSIIAHALAKDPMQRFRQPGMLANAYHRLVSPCNWT